MSIFICSICNKSFTTVQGLNAHKKVHMNLPKHEISKCCCVISKKEISAQNLFKHYNSYLKNLQRLNENKCLQCGSSTLSKFCSQSCSGKYNNNKRKDSNFSYSATSRIKKRKSRHFTTNKNDITNPYTLNTSVILINKKLKTQKAEELFLSSIVGPYTKIYKNTCSKTGETFFSSGKRKFHPTIISDRSDYRRLCQFNFSISQFPREFDYSLVEEYGWYSTPGSRKGVTNLNGISRDHIISVDYGWKNNIDPKIISHPANCQLMRHSENNKKKMACGITVEDLLLKIAEWDGKYPYITYRH